MSTRTHARIPCVADHGSMRRLSGLAATGLVLACPVWVWWVVGQQDANGDDLNYYIRPPELASGWSPYSA